MKHYDSRQRWARIAIDAWQKAQTAPAEPIPDPKPADVVRQQIKAIRAALDALEAAL